MQFVSHEIELVLCNLYLMRFDLTKDLLFDTFFIDFFEQIVSLWLLSFWIPIKYQWIGKLKVGTEIKWPMDKISVKKKNLSWKDCTTGKTYRRKWSYFFWTEF